METLHEFFLNTLGNSTYFLIDLLNFHMLFHHYLWKVQVIYPTPIPLFVFFFMNSLITSTWHIPKNNGIHDSFKEKGKNGKKKFEKVKKR